MSKFKIGIFTNWQIMFVSTVIFGLLVLFFDNSNIRYKKSLDVRRELLILQRDSLSRQIEEDSLIIYMLKNDDDFLERYAREHFYMRMDDEDLFIYDSGDES